jgi:hypothetical protein
MERKRERSREKKESIVDKCYRKWIEKIKEKKLPLFTQNMNDFEKYNIEKEELIDPGLIYQNYKHKPIDKNKKGSLNELQEKEKNVIEEMKTLIKKK